MSIKWLKRRLFFAPHRDEVVHAFELAESDSSRDLRQAVVEPGRENKRPFWLLFPMSVPSMSWQMLRF
jgi:hypothetical protein